MNSRAKFVIQRHSRQGDVHWDLMLEREGVLRTFRLPCEPAEVQDIGCTAEQIFDHPLRFLNYEGSVNKGTGQVKIADKGYYTVINASGQHEVLNMEGNYLRGKFELRNCSEDNWRFEPLEG